MLIQDYLIIIMFFSLFLPKDNDKLVPGVIGIALCDGYDAMGFEMSKPHLRSGLEADLKRWNNYI